MALLASAQDVWFVPVDEVVAAAAVAAVRAAAARAVVAAAAVAMWRTLRDCCMRVY